RLQDTFGFPLDITKDVAEEKGLRVDIEGYERLMAEQRERSRHAGEATKRHDDVVRLDVAPTAFLGYEQVEAPATVLALVSGVEAIVAASEGDEVDIVLDRTPFYPEGGGQIGDRGLLHAADG